MVILGIDLAYKKIKENRSYAADQNSKQKSKYTFFIALDRTQSFEGTERAKSKILEIINGLSSHDELVFTLITNDSANESRSALLFPFSIRAEPTKCDKEIEKLKPEIEKLEKFEEKMALKAEKDKEKIKGFNEKVKECFEEKKKEIKEKIQKKITNSEPSSNTDIWGAIIAAQRHLQFSEEGKKSNGSLRKRLILFTDGVHNVNRDTTTIKSLINLNGIEIYMAYLAESNEKYLPGGLKNFPYLESKWKKELDMKDKKKNPKSVVIIPTTWIDQYDFLK